MSDVQSNDKKKPDFSVLEKLALVQEALKVPKGQRNQFGGYNYRSKEDIFEAAKPICVKNGLILNVTDQLIEKNNRFYICAIASVTCIKTGDQFSASGWAREPESRKGMDEAQVTGSSSSYAGKYALGNLFGIDDTRDPDSTNNHGKTTEAPAVKPADKPAEAPAKKPRRKKTEKTPELKEVTDAIKNSMLKFVGQGQFAVLEKKLTAYEDSPNKKVVVEALEAAKGGAKE